MFLKLFPSNPFKITILFFTLVCSINSIGQTRVKTMFYNLLNYSSDTQSQSRATDLKTILDDIQPDLFMVCELVNETASNYLFNNAILLSNNNFDKANFQYCQSPATGLQQMVYFNKSKLILENSNIITTGIRDINHYTFKLNTENSNTSPIYIEVFVTHLKASSGETNRIKRLNSITNFTSELNNLSTNSYVIFAGDFNFYTSNEEGYQKILDTNNNIKIIDPINRPCPTFPNDGTDYFDPTNYNSSYFWNNSSFKDIHTQATRTTALSDGAGGGMDDRFDFIMMSENFNTSSNLYYVNGSYKAVGNNGNCYNSYVSNTSCSGDFSQNLRNALYTFSDHLPVIMEIETPENTLSTEDYSFGSLTNGNIISDFLELNITISAKEIYIYNSIGQLIKKSKIKELTNNKINVSELSSGLYYLKTEKNNKPLKFLKV